MDAQVADIAEHLIADRTDLDGDVALGDDLEQQRMLDQRQTMADALGVPSILSAGTKQALGIATNSGHGDDNVSLMVDFFRGLSKE